MKDLIDIKFIFYILGYRYPGIKLNKYVEVVRTSKNSIEVVHDNNVKCCRGWNIFRIFYAFFLFCLMSFEPGYLWYKIWTTPDYMSKCTLACFLSVPPIEYIIGIRYFGTNHFDDKLNWVRNSSLTPLNSEKKIVKTLLLIVGLGIILSTSMFYINTLLYTSDITDVAEYRFNDIYYIHYSISIIFCIANWVFARAVVLLNILTFMTIFTAHFSQLHNSTNILKNRQSLQFEYVQISDLCYSFLEMKSDLELSIRYLQPVYTFGTFICTVGIGIFVNLQLDELNLDIYTLASLVAYTITQIFAITLMYLVNEEKEILKMLIQSPRFTHSFLQGLRILNKDKYRVLKMKLPPRELMIRYSEYTHASVNWSILNSIIISEWDTFRLFGFTFEDGEVIQKALAFSALLITANQYAMEYYFGSS